jgi:hypothetical protein
MEDEKKERQQEKKCFLQSAFYLFNHASNLQNLKSLTQLGALASQHNYQIEYPTYEPIPRIPPKMPIFSEIKILGGIHASFRIFVLTALHKWKSCSLLVPARCEIPTRSPALKTISEPCPKKQPFFQNW